MTTVKEVRYWECSDGTTWSHAGEADHHESFLKFKELMRNLSGPHYNDEQMTTLWKHREMLKEALSGATEPTPAERLSR